MTMVIFREYWTVSVYFCRRHSVTPLWWGRPLYDNGDALLMAVYGCLPTDLASTWIETSCCVWIFVSMVAVFQRELHSCQRLCPGITTDMLPSSVCRTCQLRPARQSLDSESTTTFVRAFAVTQSSLERRKPQRTYFCPLHWLDGPKL